MLNPSKRCGRRILARTLFAVVPKLAQFPRHTLIVVLFQILKETLKSRVVAGCQRLRQKGVPRG
jgi:hypothetical protein